MNVLPKSCVRETGKDLLVFAYEDREPKHLMHLFKDSTANIADAIDTKFGAVTALPLLNKTPLQTVYVVGAGKFDEVTSAKARVLFAKGFRAAKKDVLVAFKFFEGVCEKQYARLATETFYLATYQIPQFKKEVKEEKRELYIMGNADNLDEIIADAKLNAQIVCEARKYGNYPANLFFPRDFVALVKDFVTSDAAKAAKVECTILDKEGLKKIGAGAILGVNQGSHNEPYMALLKYNGAGDAPYTALVGKGICFDSGGYSLKTGPHMRGMKMDKCGAINSFHAFKAVAEKKLAVNIMAVLPMTENLIGGGAQRVDDIVVSLSGKTIEIGNTDAEGRLILCDAITYAQQQGAKKLIDMATLTGAVGMALSEEYTGSFTNNQDMLNKLHKAASEVDEKIWQLPMDEVFTEAMKSSKLADLCNISSLGSAGASTAAAFLQEFVEEDVAWIHLDIAGSGMRSKDGAYHREGASGSMIRTLIQYFENEANN